MGAGLQCDDEIDKNKTIFCHSLCCNTMFEGFIRKLEEPGNRGWCSHLADGRLNTEGLLL